MKDTKKLKHDLAAVEKKEKKLIESLSKESRFDVTAVIEKKIPAKLQATLEAAFEKAFTLIFEKGLKVIDATCSEDKNVTANGIKDTAVTFAEGAVMGAFGIGLPDIPVFTAMIIRTVYENAHAFDFEVESKTEKLFALELISGAFAENTKAAGMSAQIDKYIYDIEHDSYTYYGLLDEFITRASKALASELLVAKFIQGIPVAGAAGGITNALTLRKIHKYSSIKYNKRRLIHDLNGLE